MKRWKDRPARPEPSPTFRWVTMWLEHAVCVVLMWFPAARMEYAEIYAVDHALVDIVGGTAWEWPYRVLQMAFAAAVAAALLPLFVKQIPKKPILIALLSVSAAFVLANLTLFAVYLASVGERTLYGLVPRCFPTIPGLLYAVFAVFAVIETIATVVALRRTDASSAGDVPCEQEEEIPVED
ncbi:MAG: hypothetical protein IJB27_07245 [Clostridia bacterium]|nr:hypothetical protein [Clostridia bacterium]